ncbi:MAG: M20 family metallopeptidase [Isosphaeraceae bacterium]|nr:M20 family metallopeptidase [Isosphaeraceae bacterium]
MQGLSLWDVLRPRRAEMVERLRSYVAHESPSRDKPALDALAGIVRARLEAIGADVEIIPNMTGGDHVRAHWRTAAGEGPPALILGHFDTVWPHGTLARLPFKVEGDRAYGPGVFDMKAGLVLVEFALRAIQILDLDVPRPVVALFTSDEEIGSPTSRRWIEEQARQSAYALVLEPPLPGGALKTARKGVGNFVVEADGKPAHAGIEPEKGISAIQEIAHQVLAIHALSRAPETTVNVGIIHGGTASNVVAAQAVARVDVRVSTRAEAERIERALHALRPVLPGALLKVSGCFNRPPMERTAGTEALFERARAISRTLGLELTEGSTGGASDANFTSAVGLPTLDGLGALGAGAHAEDEHVIVDSLPERAALLAALLLDLR